MARLFVILGVASLAWLVIWVWFFRNDPQAHPSITQAELATLPARGADNRGQKVPWMRLARRILPVTTVDFCYGWTLWLFLSWIPSFFYGNYHLNLQSSAVLSSGVLFAGVIETPGRRMLSDRLLRKTGNLVVSRAYVIVAGFLGASSSHPSDSGFTI